MKTVAEYSSEVEKGLRELTYPMDRFKSLYAPVEYALTAGGKRLRPVLVLMGADAFGGSWEPALRAAMGVEMFHNFTLLHDDVMDNSDVRRGRPSVHARFGVNAAILSGDTMLTLASRLVAEVPDAALRPVLDTFDSMALRVYEGQALDMDFERAERVTVADYEEMITLKTGALLGAAVRIGALIGGASEKDASLMYDFGVNVGLAFQIQDDWLDTFGDSNSFGKRIGGDILNGKKTYLYLSALEKSDADAEALRMAMSLEGDMRVRTVTRIYEKAGVGEACTRAVAAYMTKAVGALRKTSLSDEKKEAFRKMAEKLVGRKK